jgi:hypothetical protein
LKQLFLVTTLGFEANQANHKLKLKNIKVVNKKVVYKHFVLIILALESTIVT